MTAKTNQDHRNHRNTVFYSVADPVVFDPLGVWIRDGKKLNILIPLPLTQRKDWLRERGGIKNDIKKERGPFLIHNLPVRRRPRSSSCSSPSSWLTRPRRCRDLRRPIWSRRPPCPADLPPTSRHRPCRPALSCRSTGSAHAARHSHAPQQVPPMPPGTLMPLNR
jgi:hypothetical protein